MIDTSDFRNGLNIEVEGEMYTIVWFQHHKPGKGGAMMRTKLKNIRTGAMIERTFKSGGKFREVILAKRKKQYLYNDNKFWHFMDMETYEEMNIPKEKLGESVKFMKENLNVEGLYLDGNYIGVELPITVDLKVVHTVPGVRGDTVSSVTKPAILETGTEIQVPLFVDVGDTIRVDTRTGEYIERL